MRTAASVKGHPLHQILIPFPIAFLTGAFVADVVGRVIDNPFWWKMGAYLAAAGIVSALVAAAPGLMDYLFSVPPDSSAKKRATYHMAVNSTVVALYAVAWIVRGRAEAEPGIPVLLLEGAGAALLGVGGWLGGTLVDRNFIGPEHRYANAGKWKEEKLERKQGRPLVAAKADELEVDQMKLLHVGDKRIALARTEKGYVAFDDRCTHKGGPLADGVMICGTVQCKWHGSQFDCGTGKVKAGPAEKPVKTYDVEEKDGEVRLKL